MMDPTELKPILERVGGFSRPTIHIAGSKGKGSTAMLLAHLLERKGQKLGLFISPYIVDELECIQVNGSCITQEDFDRLKLDLPSELSPFEQRTLAALRYYEEQRCDFVVLETGWGGRRDATNVVESKVLTILTHVELEHTSTLGDSIEAIATEKLGISRPHVPLLTPANQNPAVFDLYWEDLVMTPERILGHHHPESVGLAITAVEMLGFQVNADDLSSMESLELPGRFEIVSYGPHTLIMDGAHTIDSVHYVKEKVEEYMNDHAFSEVTWAIHFLKDKADELSFGFPKTHTLWIPIEDERAGLNLGKYPEISADELLKTLDSQTEKKLIVILGSFKLLAAIKQALKR